MGRIVWSSSFAMPALQAVYTAQGLPAAAAAELWPCWHWAGPVFAGEVSDQYAGETGYQPYIFEESSPGSAAVGYLKVTPANQI
jgi:hypothetical protein